MPKPFLFLVTGALATLLQYVVLIAGVERGGWRPDIASAIGYAASASFNYYSNYRWTFRSRGPHFGTVIRFAMMAGSGLAINQALMWILAVLNPVHYVVAQVLTTAVILAWNYLVASRWVYRPPAP